MPSASQSTDAVVSESVSGSEVVGWEVVVSEVVGWEVEPSLAEPCASVVGPLLGLAPSSPSLVEGPQAGATASATRSDMLANERFTARA
jgi:hypothetical protein